MQSPPWSEIDERMALGCAMLSAEATDSLLGSLVELSFYDPRHRRIYAAISAVAAKSVAVDAVSVASELHKHNALEEVGGAEYVTGAVLDVTSPLHCEGYISKVKDYATLRALGMACGEIAADCDAHELEASDILEKAESKIYAISESGTQSQIVSARESIHDHIAGMERLKESGGVIGLPTGFDSVDKITSGLHPGNMVTLAARPGMGKSSFALDLARYAALKGNGVAFFSLEMTRSELFNRLLSAITGITLFKIQHAFLTSSEWHQVHSAAEKLYDSPLYLECSGMNITPMSIRSTCRRLASKLLRENKKLSLIVVDYLQLLTSKSKKFENRQAEVSDISRSLKGVAIDLNVPVLALSQLNRQTEEYGGDGRPRLSNLRESGSIEQDSDVVMFIYRPAFYKAGVSVEEKAQAKLMIAKHRNGASGDIDLYFDGEHTRFLEVTQNEEALI